jgi:hypothetical protein
MACETGEKLLRGLRDAVYARVLAQARLEIIGRDEEFFASRWDEFVIAKEAWASAVFAHQVHMRNCVQCQQVTVNPKAISHC